MLKNIVTFVYQHISRLIKVEDLERTKTVKLFTQRGEITQTIELNDGTLVIWN